MSVEIFEVNIVGEHPNPSVVFGCPECTEKYGFKVQYVVPIERRGDLPLTIHSKRVGGKWARYRSEFEEVHDKCGEQHEG